jgi:hypothetical protein
MLVDGEWIAVPEYTIQYRALPGDTGETAGGHWCGDIRTKHGDGLDYSTHCAILPPNPAVILGPSFALRESRLLLSVQMTFRKRPPETMIRFHERQLDLR